MLVKALCEGKATMTEEQIKRFSKDGYFIIHNAFSQTEIGEMRSRIEDLVRGKFAKQGRRFQVDSGSDNYEDVNHGKMTYSGPNVDYRKISDLEYDEVILQNLQIGWIQKVCSQLVDDVVSIMRVTMMDKPPQGGAPLPWHQDISVDWPTTVLPKLTIWFPLDQATQASGSLQVVSGSHHHGMIDKGHLLPQSLEEQFAPTHKIVDVNIDCGDCLFFHPGLLHRSGVNRTDFHRRAINAIFMPGRSFHTIKKRFYPVLFGEGQLDPAQVAAMDEIPN